MSDSTSTKRKLERPGKSLGLAAAMFVTAAAIGFGSLYAMGVPFLGQDPVAAVAPEQEVVVPVVNAKPTDAETALTALIKDPASNWVPRGSSIRQASNPLPYSCPASDTAAALSIGHAYMVGGSSVQVVATAHGAGLGAEALGALSKRAYSCASGRTSLSHWAETGVGTQAFSSIAGANRTTAVRRGDVILYVTGGRSAPTKALALQLDKRLVELAAKTCKNPGAQASDGTRNLLSTAGYEPFRVTKNLRVKDPGLPVPEADAEYAPVDLRKPLPEAPDEATPAQQPSWPVWPNMPEPMQVPVVPVAPAPKAPTEGSIKVLAKDASGPGCGWDFTGSAAPIFDEPAAQKENDQAITVKLSELTTLVDQWQERVLSYWAAADRYDQEREKYQKYAGAVDKVNSAWQVIATQWDRYHREKAAWDETVRLAEELRTNQEAARKLHTDQLAQCEADNAAYVPPVDPTQEPSAPPAPTVEPTPEETPDTEEERDNAPKPALPVDCAATFPSPAILDLTVVPPGPEPSKPADPRPASEVPPVEEPAA